MEDTDLIHWGVLRFNEGSELKCLTGVWQARNQRRRAEVLGAGDEKTGNNITRRGWGLLKWKGHRNFYVWDNKEWESEKRRLGTGRRFFLDVF